MGKPLVGVILGSRVDFNIMRRGLESLRVMGVPYVFEMASPHRSPERLARFALSATEMGLEVIICAAGGSGHLAGVLASYTTLPIIAVPIDSTTLRGEDALHSMVQMPPGIPVATVGINNGENAALLATQILANKYPHYKSVLKHARAALGQRLDSAYKELLSEYPDLCDLKKTAPPYLKPSAVDDDTDSGEQETQGGESDTDDNSSPIRPGASLGIRADTVPAASAGELVSTPVPHEPGRATEAGAPSTENDTPMVVEEESLPPPPRDSDLAPRPMSIEKNFGAAFVRSAIAASAETPPPPSSLDSTDEILLQLERALRDTKLFQIEHDNPDEDILAHAMMVLLEGGIIALPTDTVYGLAVDALNPAAVRSLYELKGQESARKSLSVLIHTPDMLETLVKEVPAAIETVMERFWPGALTILFFKQSSVLASVSDSPSIAIRIPRDAIALRLIEMVRRPLVVINASFQDSPAATNSRELLDRFDGKIDCILDAGPCTSAQTSTVLSVLTEPFEILREGAVGRGDIKLILGDKLKG